MGFGDVIVPSPQIKKMPTQIENFEEPELMTYSLESTIAEKLDAIISRMELSSRMKDYYDIYYLACAYNFEARKLQEAIYETLQNRGTPFGTDTMNKVHNFCSDKSMQIKWKHFAKGSLKMELEFKNVLDIIFDFVNPIIIAIIQEDEVFGSWNPKKLKYE